VTNPRRVVAEAVVNHRTKRRSSWRVVGTTESAALHLDRLPRAPFPACTTAPWSWGCEGLNVNLAVLTEEDIGAGSSLLECVLGTLQAAGPRDYIVYTDGSLPSGSESGGCAAVVCNGASGRLQVVATIRQRVV
jgi:hypothetical protein